MEDYNISDAQLSQSSFINTNYKAPMARLNSPKCWLPYTQSTAQWLQVKFQRQVHINGIITQGRKGIGQYVMRYKLRQSLDALTWSDVLDENGDTDVSFNC